MLQKSTAYALISMLAAGIAVAPVVLAAPAAEIVFEVEQPDGKQLRVINRGDEWNNWIETLDGYTVARAIDGYWYFVKEFVDGKPQLDETLAHEPPPVGTAKHLRPHRPPGRPDLLDTSPAESLQNAPRGSFSGKILYVLAEFDDRAGTTSEASWASLIASNVADYFYDASHAQVTLAPAQEGWGLANDGVVGWVSVGANHPNTGADTDDRNRQLTRDAILAADPYVDFASFDLDFDGYVDADELAVVVIVAGYERGYSAAYAPNVWGHKWGFGGSVTAPIVDGVRVGDYHAGGGGYAQFGELHRSSETDQHQATMGIQVHELGHLVFGLPDLYDTDGSSSGIGVFGVMGGGSWGKASTDSWPGETPVLPCAWTRYVMTWADGHAGAGTTSVTAAGSQFATSADTVFRASTEFSNEYFLVENRQPSGYDRGLWGRLGSFGGLAVWHVDESQFDNTNDAHRLVDLEEADGTEMGTTRGEASDLWFSGNATVFDATTIPNSNLYSGGASGVGLYDISASFAVMTLRFGVAGDTNELTIYNDGDATLSITSMTLDIAADWIDWLPQAPFDVAAGSSVIVTVTVDFGLAPAGDSTRRLLIESNDPDESPYPGGVDIVVHNSASHLLSVTTTGNGTGTVTSHPAGIDCAPDCQESYATGTVVQLSAHPGDGSLFAGWGGDPDCEDASVVMSADRSCTAAFVLCVEMEDACDGVDNDCDGMVDELPEYGGFTIPGDRETFCWIPLSGGETYEAVRSSGPDFPAGCTTHQTADACWSDTVTPASGEVFYYLARVATPVTGSWGGASGAERVDVCGMAATTSAGR